MPRPGGAGRRTQGSSAGASTSALPNTLRRPPKSGRTGGGALGSNPASATGLPPPVEPLPPGEREGHAVFCWVSPEGGKLSSSSSPHPRHHFYAAVVVLQVRVGPSAPPVTSQYLDTLSLHRGSGIKGASEKTEKRGLGLEAEPEQGKQALLGLGRCAAAPRGAMPGVAVN